MIDHNDWPIQKLPGFDRLYEVIEHGEPATMTEMPIDSLWLGRRTIDNADNQIAAARRIGATIVYLDTLVEPQGAASLEMTHHQDSTGFARLETVDGTLSYVEPGETVQPGDAIFVIDATYGCRVINAAGATVWMTGLGMQRMGSCQSHPC